MGVASGESWAARGARFLPTIDGSTALSLDCIVFFLPRLGFFVVGTGLTLPSKDGISVGRVERGGVSGETGSFFLDDLSSDCIVLPCCLLFFLFGIGDGESVRAFCDIADRLLERDD